MGRNGVTTAGGASYTDQIQVPSISMIRSDLAHGLLGVTILQYPLGAAYRTNSTEKLRPGPPRYRPLTST